MTPPASAFRTFTPNESANRDAWIRSRTENDCTGCEEDDRGWTPAEDCLVHGVDCGDWWRDLNVELDRRWPGTWAAQEQAAL